MGREILKIVQIPKSELSEELFDLLEEEKSFTDTDETLNEFIVSTSVLLDILKEPQSPPEVLTQCSELYKELSKYDYIQVTSI